MEKFRFPPPVDTDDPDAVLEEVRAICLTAFPDFDFGRVEKVFGDVVRLFDGDYPGYRECNTEYHDLRHTLDVFLAMARLIHGLKIGGQIAGEEAAALGLISALMHDTGYIQEAGDNGGTGAKYTLVHVERSVGFMEGYFAANGFSEEDSRRCRDLIRSTALEAKLADIPFESAEMATLGKAHLAADLIGQMADRFYLEKLLYLFKEFKEGNVAGYETEADLLEKTFGFYSLIVERLGREFEGMDRFMQNHFRARCGIDMNLYRNKMEKNIGYLKHVMENHSGDYREMLKRGEFVKRLKRKEKAPH